MCLSRSTTNMDAKVILLSFTRPVVWRAFLPFCGVLWKPQQKLHVLWDPSCCIRIHQLVLPLRRRDVASSRVERQESFPSSVNFLASGWRVNEAKWSPKARDVRGLRCPLVRRTNNITFIRPPWLHLYALSLKEIVVVDERRLFCLCSMNAFYFTAQNKFPSDVMWGVATKLLGRSQSCKKRNMKTTRKKGHSLCEVNLFHCILSR